MTASEILRALGDEFAGAPWLYETSTGEIGDLRDALPLIVAVVEAAERVTFFGQEEYRFNEWHGSEIVRALTALQEHLGAE